MVNVNPIVFPPTSRADPPAPRALLPSARGPHQLPALLLVFPVALSLCTCSQLASFLIRHVPVFLAARNTALDTPL
ncbi:hypothetical protein GUJ93_ZPchr0013g36956 [Zizania palustris]|uniref:Uncharacterized protein n=1 Tax=Zizania palustris TaxID=103762 RepID=A0A8J5WV19_ZIZPA|nr:hypothetical protein GUJ93_ZPchr0013g36956 [Zizania palustris]